MKRTFPLLFLPLLVFMFLFPKLSLDYAKTGLMLWFYTLLPSMLPFMILSNVFLRTHMLDHFFLRTRQIWHRLFRLSSDGAYALLMGVFCGYPMGAKITADLYREKRISKEEASYLLTFVSHAGPSFLSAYLCIGLFQRADLLFPSYLILYTGSFLCSLSFRPHGAPSDASFASAPEKDLCKTQKEISSIPSLGEILDISIMDAFASITRLGGYIILFSMIQGILKQLFRPLPDIKYLLLGLTEISTGTAAIAQSSLSFHIAYPLALACTSSGGLCVAAQTKSMLADTDLSLKPYVKGRIFCFACTLLLAYLSVEIIEIVV